MSTTPDLLPRYTFNPLPVTRVRLLKLQPAKSDQDEINCELIERDLTDIDLSGGNDSSTARGPANAGATRNAIDTTQPGTQEAPYEHYEAVSWCWGTDLPDQPIRINENDTAYSFLVSQSLAAALRAFRYVGKTRLLWVDAICINQESKPERNQQVPRMNQIYGQASNVLIWVGEDTPGSRRAMTFIREKVLKLWSFDKLCDDTDMGPEWKELSLLMKRRWFSRRWVVQEIALAERGILYCGKEWISWNDFADAVSLFVEAEAVTHKLSEIMRKDHNFDQIQNFYGHVPALGAALLVDATSSLFRSSRTGVNERKERLLSLEYLVSRYTVFEASEPRDTIYALLAIAKDTTPQALQHEFPAKYNLLKTETKGLLGTWAGKVLKSKVYTVDYSASLIKVYEDFIMFAIAQAEPKYALNIICRPWAPRHRKDPRHKGANGNLSSPTIGGKASTSSDEELGCAALPSWIPDLSGAPFVMQAHANELAGERMDRQNADSLVGMPGDQRSYSAAGMKSISMKELNVTIQDDYHIMSVEGFILDQIAVREDPSQAGNIPPEWPKLANWTDTSELPPAEFWRTLVADRGPNGGTTQSFYPRACQEAWTKAAGVQVLITERIIEEGRSTVIAEFLRRVQAVIWNRSLVRTARGHLGLVHKNAGVDDSICILYGCSVPVVLRKFKKSEATLQAEHLQAETAREIARLEQKKVAWEMLRRAAERSQQRPKSTNAPQNSAVDWSLVRFAAFCVLVGFTEYRHGLTFRGAALFNSLLFVLLHPFDNVRPTLRHQSWARVLKGTYQIARLYCAVRLIAHVFRWTEHVLERLAVVACFSILLHCILMSEDDYKYFITAKWYHEYREQYNEEKKTKRPPKALPERKSLLEPAQHYWKLIGECYIDGMMDGEAITLQNREGIRPKIFELR